MPNQSLFMAVVDRGRAEDVLNELRAFGVGNGVVLFGEGTVSNRWLEILGLDETQKEVILLTVSERLEEAMHEMMLQSFKINKRRRGIAFSIPLNRYNRVRYWPADQRVPKDQFPYHCIVTILDEGKSRDFVKVARDAGAPGGTIIHGRGAGVPAEESFFDLVIEPQKDIVFILVPTEKAAHIRQVVVEEMNLDKPGNGILFVLPVTRATGLYQAKEEN